MAFEITTGDTSCVCYGGRLVLRYSCVIVLSEAAYTC